MQHLHHYRKSHYVSARFLLESHDGLQGGSGDESNYIRGLNDVTMNKHYEDSNGEDSRQIPVPLTACDLCTASTPTTVSYAVSLQVTFFSFIAIISIIV